MEKSETFIAFVPPSSSSFFSLSLFFSVQIFIIKWWWVLGRVVRASGVKMGHLPRGLQQKWTFAVREKELSSIQFYLYSEFCCSLTRHRARVSKARWYRLSPIMVLLLISLHFQLSLCAWSRATAILFFRRDLCVSLSWLLWWWNVSDISPSSGLKTEKSWKYLCHLVLGRSTTKGKKYIFDCQEKISFFADDDTLLLVGRNKISFIH